MEKIETCVIYYKDHYLFTHFRFITRHFGVKSGIRRKHLLHFKWIFFHAFEFLLKLVKFFLPSLDAALFSCARPKTVMNTLCSKSLRTINNPIFTKSRSFFPLFLLMHHSSLGACLFIWVHSLILRSCHQFIYNNELNTRIFIRKKKRSTEKNYNLSTQIVNENVDDANARKIEVKPEIRLA